MYDSFPFLVDTVSVFGPDAEVLNFDRDPTVLGKMMTFNGNHNDIVRAGDKGDFDTPPRRCPGYGNAMDIIEFLVDRYCPTPNEDIASVPPARIDEIQRKETWFMRFVLKMGQITYASNNKYFPHASEVKHPLDTNGRKIGSLMIAAAGDRNIPVYGTYNLCTMLKENTMFDGSKTSLLLPVMRFAHHARISTLLYVIRRGCSSF